MKIPLARLPEIAKRCTTFFGAQNIVVAADGKSRTVTAHGADEQGKESKEKAAYDKQ